MLEYRLRYLIKNEVLVLAADGAEAELNRELGLACNKDS